MCLSDVERFSVLASKPTCMLLSDGACSVGLFGRPCGLVSYGPLTFDESRLNLSVAYFSEHGPSDSSVDHVVW